MKIKSLLASLLSFSMFLPVLAQTLPAPPPPPQKPADTKQKPADDQDDVVRITTNLVQVDAVVTKDGKVVTNLTADDFEIYEDGKKQTITSFAYISNVPGSVVAQPPVAKREKGANLPPPPAITRDQPHRTIAFVVDDLGLSAESMSQVRKQLRKFVAEQLQPNDLVAIIRTGGEMGALQQFTNDKRILTRAVDQLRWKICNRVGFAVFTPTGSEFGPSWCARNAMSNTLKSLRFIIDAMGFLPGRKSLVLMSDSMPREDQDQYFVDRNFLSEGGGLSGGGSSGRPTPVAAGAGDDGASPFPSDTINYASALQKIAEKAIRSSVVIYSVDTQGLQYTGPTAVDQFRGNARQITAQINATLSTRSNLLWSRREGGELIAKQTGGYQVRNSNGFKLNEIVEDQSGYYLLGYRPSEETFNRKFHHLKAKVKRGGMSLRTRFGFFGVTEDEAVRTRLDTRDMTNLALASPFAAQDIDVDISSFYASDNSGSAVVRSFVYIDANDMTFTAVDGKQQASFDVHGVLFGDNGSIAEQVKRGATVSLSPEHYEYAMRNGMQFTVDIPVKKPGAYQIRIATRDKASNRIGSAGEFVAVPNLRDKRLAVSGVILGTDSDPGSQSLASPGARRFTPNSAVHFAYVIYNAANETGALRNLVMQAKLFRDGKEVFAGLEVPVKAAANQTDLSRVLASGSVRLAENLEPGGYYLQVSVMEVGSKDNKVVPVVQWAAFEVEQ